MITKMRYRRGDYVLATKYSDGDPGDQWCVGIYDGFYVKDNGAIRYDVVDEGGRLFRMNGFRRIKKISPERGAFILSHMRDIEMSRRSLWWWLTVSMKKTNKFL